jgi:hypothetical protein
MRKARNFYGSDQYITRLNTEMMTSATSSAATTLANQVLQRNDAANILRTAPSGSLIGAFSYNQHNLAPFNQDAVSWALSQTDQSMISQLMNIGYRCDNCRNGVLDYRKLHPSTLA